MRRRTLLIGLATLGFGSSGFIASGAFSLGSSETDNGNWTQINDIEETDSSSEARIETVVDPTSGRVGSLNTSGVEIMDSDAIIGDDDGRLQSINIQSINRGARTSIGQVGRVTGDERAAFLIANTGGVDTDGVEGVPLEVRVGAYDQPDPTESDRIDFNGSFEFPYSVLSRERSGSDLLHDTVRLEPREIVCVGIRIDSTRPANFNDIERFGMSVRNLEET